MPLRLSWHAICCYVLYVIAWLSQLGGIGVAPLPWQLAWHQQHTTPAPKAQGSLQRKWEQKDDDPKEQGVFCQTVSPMNRLYK